MTYICTVHTYSYTYLQLPHHLLQILRTRHANAIHQPCSSCVANVLHKITIAFPHVGISCLQNNRSWWKKIRNPKISHASKSLIDCLWLFGWHYWLTIIATIQARYSRAITDLCESTSYNFSNKANLSLANLYHIHERSTLKQNTLCIWAQLINDHTSVSLPRSIDPHHCAHFEIHVRIESCSKPNLYDTRLSSMTTR